MFLCFNHHSNLTTALGSCVESTPHISLQPIKSFSILHPSLRLPRITSSCCCLSLIFSILTNFVTILVSSPGATIDKYFNPCKVQ